MTEAEVAEFAFVFLRAVSEGQSSEQVPPLNLRQQSWYQPLRCSCMRPSATSVWGLKLLVAEALSY